MQRGSSSSQLDYVLVPLGLAVMLGYHLWLLLRIRRRPETTVIGINAINRRIWVRHIMEEPSGKHAVLAVQTMRNSIMASTVLASVAITLSSLAAALMASGAGDGEAALTAKFLAVLVCFLAAFLLNVQSIRYYTHAGLLVNVPLAARRPPSGTSRGRSTAASASGPSASAPTTSRAPSSSGSSGPSPCAPPASPWSPRSTSSTSTGSGTRTTAPAMATATAGKKGRRAPAEGCCL